MARVPKLKSSGARTAEEQMLASMLVAGLSFAVVSLVTFLRPSRSVATANIKEPELRLPVHSQTRSATTSGPSSTSSTRTESAAQNGGALTSSGTVMQQLQDLFASVLSPSDFSTESPRTLQPAPWNVAVHQPGASSATTTLPPAFQPVTTGAPAKATTTTAVDTTTTTTAEATTTTAGTTTTSSLVSVTTPGQLPLP